MPRNEKLPGEYGALTICDAVREGSILPAMRLLLILMFCLAGGSSAAATPTWECVTVAPMKTSIYVGSVHLISSVLERQGEQFTATYEARVFPWAFWSERGTIRLHVPPAELARAVINIHPSLIPSFCGDGFYGHHVHDAVKKRGCTVTGCTVHFADENYDEGPIILQKCVEIAYEDDADTIADKVFAMECVAFPEAINRVDQLGMEFFWKRMEL
jgi:hypothetical protein